MQWGNVRVIERRQNFTLTLETLHYCGRRSAGADNFQRDIFPVDAVGANGQLRQVPEFKAELRLPAKGLGPLELNLIELGSGHYAAANVLVPFAGDWQLVMTVRTSDVDQASTTAVMPVK